MHLLPTHTYVHKLMPTGRVLLRASLYSCSWNSRLVNCILFTCVITFCSYRIYAMPYMKRQYQQWQRQQKSSTEEEQLALIVRSPRKISRLVDRMVFKTIQSTFAWTEWFKKPFGPRRSCLLYTSPSPRD